MDINNYMIYKVIARDTYNILSNNKEKYTITDNYILSVGSYMKLSDKSYYQKTRGSAEELNSEYRKDEISKLFVTSDNDNISCPTKNL